MNRARPMATRLKKIPRADYEPRSAHGRAVKKNTGRLCVALQFRPARQTCLTRLDQLYVLLFLPMKLRCVRVL